MRGTAVDLVLRDLARVQEQCERARHGEFAFHPQPGHPLGFLDVSYAGEVANAVVLADPEDALAGLRARLLPYPDALRRAMVANLWQAGFLVQAARKGIAKQDIAYVQLCCSQALMLCAHAWHAAAGQWPTNEKGLVVDVAGLPLETHGFTTRAAGALVCPGHGGAHLAAVVDRTEALVDLTRGQLGG